MDQDAPKLSLIAQYDDMLRISQSILEEDMEMYDGLITFFKSLEDSRLKWLQERRKFSSYATRIYELEKENQSINVHLKHVQDAMKKELLVKDSIMKEKNTLCGKLNQIKNVIEKEEEKRDVKEKILSYLYHEPLTTLLEASNSDSSENDIVYDKTGEDLLDVENAYPEKQRRRSSRRKISESNEISKRIRIEINEALDKQRLEDETKKIGSHNDSEFIFIKDDEINNIGGKQNHEDVFKTPSSTPIDSPRNFPNATSTPTLRNRVNRNPSKEEISLVYSSKMKKRPHHFVSKKIFKPEKCVPCGRNIGFYSTCYRCHDCRAICHIECKSKVPLPCIPYVPPSPGNKHGRLIKIADFVPISSRPSIPAIIIHCCSEIEKRGIQEQGLYRIPGSDKDVRELKDKILNSKTGMPLLDNVDIHVLCGVVKKFLISLDEPLLTSVLWRDFVRASEMEEDDSKKTHLYQAVSELPESNRDTLAYLMLHLQKVSGSPACQMPITNIAKMFGPTLLGNSIPDPPPMTIIAESKKQMKVIEALLNLPKEYWNNFIDQYANQENNPSKSAPSIARVRGGSVTSGLLSPLRYSAIAKKPQTLKPLF